MSPLAIDTDYQQLPAWERQVDRIFQLPSITHPSAKIDIHAIQIEQTLRRDLVHRGVVGENQVFETKLIAWIEIV